jgi:uncharacterized protein YraI
MQIRSTIIVAAATAVAALSQPVYAATVASAVTPLNIRSGPGPQYSVIGAIPANAQATVIGCIQGSLWCQISFNGNQGWAYSQYLTTTISGRSLALSQRAAELPPVTYAAPPATVGTAIAPPTISGEFLAPVATAAPLSIAPPPATVQTYVVGHPVSPVYLNGEVVEGAGLPADVVLNPVPNYNYDYAYVNGVPVLVEPATRRVTYIYR